MRRNRLTWSAIAFLLMIGGCDSGLDVPGPTTEDTAWRLVNPRPFDVRINDLWGPSVGRVMAVGDRGAIVTREGDKWREAPRPTRTDIYDIHGYDWQNIWATCAEGLLFFDGSGWELQRPGNHDRGDRIFCRAPDDVMVVTGERLSLHYNGESWTAQTLEIRPVSRDSDWLVGWAGGFTAVGRDGKIATWQDGQWGAAVELFGQPALTHIMVISDSWDPPEDTVLAAFGISPSNPESIGIYESYATTNWNGWNSIPNARDVVDIAPGGPDGGFYIVARASDQDTLQVSRNYYQPDILAFPGLDDGIFRVFRNTLDRRNERDHFVLAGPFGSFYAGNDEVGIENSLGGVPFEVTKILVWPNGDFTGIDRDSNLIHGRNGQVTIQNDAISSPISNIWGPSPDLIYAVGYNGLILRLSGDAPAEIMTSPVSNFLTAIWGTGPNNIWASGFDAFLHFNGSAWTSTEVPDNFAGHQIAGTASGDVFALSNYQIQKWDGSTWTRSSPPSSDVVEFISAAPTGQDLFAVAWDFADENRAKTLKRLRNGVWESLATMPENPRSLIALSDESVIVAANEGCLIWRNGKWSPITHPSSIRSYGNIRNIYGRPDGGIYSISGERSIHYLDLGGTALWH